MSLRYHFDQELDRLRSRLIQLWDLVGVQFEAALNTYHDLDLARIHEVNARETEINALRHTIDDAAIELLATQQPTAGDLRLIVSLMNLAGELERIGDHAQGVTRATEWLRKLSTGARPPQPEQMGEQALAMFAQAKAAFEKQDLQMALGIGPQDDVVDRAYSDLFNELTVGLAFPEASVQAEAASEYMYVGRELERIADRVLNLAEYTSFLITGKLQETEAGRG